MAEGLDLNGDDRLSIYRFEDDAFKMVGRYSQHPELRRRGRSVYPSGQGVIGNAWKSADGRCYVDDLPDPVLDVAQYRAKSSQDWGLTASTVNSLQMKSRSIAAFVLNDSKTGMRNAMIVFESLRPNRFDIVRLSETVSGSLSKELPFLLETLSRIEPSLAIAKRGGF